MFSTLLSIITPIKIDPWQLVDPDDILQYPDQYPEWYWGMDAEGFVQLYWTYAWIEPSTLPNFVEYA
jgi:hypothetical protein